MPYQLRQSSYRTATSAQPAHRRPRRPPRTAHQLVEQHSRGETAAQVTDNLKRLKEGLTLLLIWPAVPGRAGVEDARRPQAAEA